MTNIKSLSLHDLQIRMIKSIELFFKLQQISGIEDTFIQEKLHQISEQYVEFRKFVKESISHSLNLSCNAEDLIIFVKHCDDDQIDNKVLLDYLNPLLIDTRLLQKESIKLKGQITSIKDCLEKIAHEINEHDLKITKRREELPEQIDREDKKIDDAISYAKSGIMTFGIGAVAVIAAPITGGASLVHLAQLAVAQLGAIAVVGGAVTATASTAVAINSSIRSANLCHELVSGREQISQILQEMQESLKDIQIGIVTLCESHWESQIIKIECIIKKLERDNRNKLLGESISVKAKKILEDSDNYCINMQEALNKYSIKSK